MREIQQRSDLNPYGWWIESNDAGQAECLCGCSVCEGFITLGRNYEILDVQQDENGEPREVVIEPPNVVTPAGRVVNVVRCSCESSFSARLAGFPGFPRASVPKVWIDGDPVEIDADGKHEEGSR